MRSYPDHAPACGAMAARQCCPAALPASTRVSLELRVAATESKVEAVEQLFGRRVASLQ